jgi:hypothetical protein
METKQILAIIGGIIGLIIVLAAIFNWKIIPVPSQNPSIGSPAGQLSPGVRLACGIVGAILVVLAILTLTGTI